MMTVEASLVPTEKAATATHAATHANKSLLHQEAGTKKKKDILANLFNMHHL